ncbi:MAG: ATP-binding protein [Actinomycetota bacterium]
MPDTVQIALSPRPEFVGAVRHVLGALGRLAEFDAGSVEDLKLAVSEAVTNAITRGAQDATADVRLVATREPGAVTIEVVDAGPVFDPQAAAAAQDSVTSQEFSFEAGLSLPVVRGLVEDLELVPGEDEGLTVRFTVTAERAGTDAL